MPLPPAPTPALSPSAKYVLHEFLFLCSILSGEAQIQLHFRQQIAFESFAVNIFHISSKFKLALSSHSYAYSIVPSGTGLANDSVPQIFAFISYFA